MRIHRSPASSRLVLVALATSVLAAPSEARAASSGVLSRFAAVLSASASAAVPDDPPPSRPTEATDLSTLDPTVKRRVRGVYFSPRDRPFRSCLADRLDTFIKMAQRLFQEEMAAAGRWDPWGQGKTFPFEADSEGRWKVVFMVGEHDTGWYHERWPGTYPGTPAFDEMCRRLPTHFGTENVVVFMYDLAVLEDGLVYYAGQGGSGAPWSGEGAGYTLQGSHFLGLGFDTVAVRIEDQAAMFEQTESSTMTDYDGDLRLHVLTRGELASTAVGAAIHELGHAFYLGHDFKDYDGDGIETNLLGHGFRRLSGRYTPTGFLPPTELGPLHTFELDTAVLFNEGVPPTELLRDDGDPGTSSEGTWYVSGGTFPYGARSVYANEPGAAYTFSLAVPEVGRYRVSLRWTEWPSRLSDVPVEIRHAAGATVVRVDQTTGASRWNDVGRYTFRGSASIAVRSLGGGSTCADGVRLVRVREARDPAAELRMAPRPEPAILDGGSRALAFAASMGSAHEGAALAWRGATFENVGTGDAPALILRARLHEDRDGDGALDPDDPEIGGPAAFEPGDGTLRFEGLSVTFDDSNPVRFLLVCDLIPEVRQAGGLAAASAWAIALLGAACLLLAGRRGGLRELPRLGGALALVLVLGAWLHLSGCGGDGGGAGPLPAGRGEIQMRLAGLDVADVETGEVAVVPELPVTAWAWDA